MALETTGKIIIDVQESVNSVEQLEASIKQAKDTLVSSAEGTKEYTDALTTAANAQFKLDEITQKIAGSATNLESVLSNGVQVVSGFASGFAAAQGALALFGVENEELEETLVKVQGAMALATGLQGIQGMGKAVTNLITQLRSFSVVQKAITALQWLWNAAMEANPIGAVVVAIAALAAAVYGLTEIFSDSTDEIDENTIAMDGSIHTSEEARDEYNKQIETLADLEIQYNLLTGAITESEAAIMRLGIENSKELAKIRKDTKEKLEEMTGFWSQLWEVASHPLTDPRETLRKIQEDVNKTFEEGLQQQENQREIYDKRLEIINERAAQKEEERLKREFEKRQREIERLQKEADDRARKIQEENNKLIIEQEKSLVEDENSLFDEREANAIDNEVAITDFAKSAASARIAIAKDEAEQKERLRMAELDAIGNSFNIISNLSSLFAGQSAKEQEKAFKIQKAANIANATIDTYASATASYKALAGIPIVGPALGAIAAAAAVTAGLLNIKNIAAQKFQASGAGSSSSTPGFSSSQNTANVVAPNIQQSITPTRNQLTSDEITLQNEPVRAYVVESDISEKQNKVNLIKNESSF